MTDAIKEATKEDIQKAAEEVADKNVKIEKKDKRISDLESEKATLESALQKGEIPQQVKNAYQERLSTIPDEIAKREQEVLSEGHEKGISAIASRDIGAEIKAHEQVLESENLDPVLKKISEDKIKELTEQKTKIDEPTSTQTSIGEAETTPVSVPKVKEKRVVESKKPVKVKAIERNFTDGKRAEDKAIEEGVQFNTPEEASKYIAEHSENPMEILQAHDAEGSSPSERDYKSQIIESYATSVNPESYARFGDRNNINSLMAKKFFAKKGKKSKGIDQIAQEASDAAGLEITPKDIVEFMENDKYVRKTSPVQEALKKKFKELTGLVLNEKNTKLAIEKALEKQTKDYEQYLQREAESTSELEQQYYDAIKKGDIHIEKSEDVSPIEGNKQGKEGTPTETIRAKEINGLIEKANEELSAAENAFKSKAKELDKELLADQEDIFGERKTDGGMFDERADATQRNKVLEPFKERINKSKEELADLQEKLKEEAGKKDAELFDEEVERKKVQDNLQQKSDEINKGVEEKKENAKEIDGDASKIVQAKFLPIKEAIQAIAKPLNKIQEKRLIADSYTVC